MLSTIELEADASVETLVERFNACWGNSKVVHITGRRFSDEKAMRAFYDAFMERAGTPAEVGEDATQGDRNVAQRTGQRWTEIRYDPSIPDAYRHSANAQPLHTDGSYVPDFPDAAIIYCQASAANGGETIFLASEDLVSIMREEAPDMLDELSSEVLPHRRSGTEKIRCVIEDDEGDVTLTWNYYCVADDVTEEQATLRQRFHDYLRGSERIGDAVKPVGLRPGECVVWKDERVLHGRNGFDPSRPSERFMWKGAFASSAA